MPMPTFTNLGDLIDRDRDLTKIAIIDLGGEETPREYTYAELDAMTKGVARALAKRGFARGDRVAILSANRAEYHRGLFRHHARGLRRGAGELPVSAARPSISSSQDCRREAGVLRPRAARGLSGGPAGRGVRRARATTASTRFVDPGAFETVVPEPDEPAMFLYTSGSTGTPKGVVLSHQSHIWVVETRLAPGLDRHRYLIAAPLYHMNALALAKLACAAHATIVLLPQFDGARLHRGDRALSPDLAHRGAADDRHDAARAARLLASTDLSSVEFIRMGSAPVSASLMEAIHRALPKAAVTNAYGTTEAGPVVFGPHPKGLPQPDNVGRLSASEGRSCAWSTAATATPSRACWR